MKIFSTSIALATLMVNSAFAALTIDTPVSVVSGHPTLIEWTGGLSPFFVIVGSAGDVGGAAIADLGEHKGHAAIWNTDVAPGTAVFFSVKDSTGAVAQSAPVSVSA